MPDQDELIEAMQMFEPKVICMTNEEIKQRTNKQNNALHKYCDMQAEKLNDAGFSVNDKVAVKLDIPWTKENYKTFVIHPVMKALYPEVNSTAKLSTRQMQHVYNVVDKAISERTGIRSEWPSDEPPMVGGE